MADGVAKTGVERTAGALLVAQLEALGVPRVYGVPGESYLEVLDALHDSPIDMVVCRQEGGAGFMALAEARLTGRPGVVAVTRGPGAANAAIGWAARVSDELFDVFDGPVCSPDEKPAPVPESVSTVRIAE